MGTVLIGSCSGLKDINRKCTESDILSLLYAVISLFLTILSPEKLASEEKMASVLTAHPFWRHPARGCRFTGTFCFNSINVNHHG